AAMLQKLASVSRSRAVTLPTSVAIKTGQLASERFVGEDVWNWPIFEQNFDAPAIMELARLQTWTLKPALLLSAAG
ncbi:MAG: hypothetical protein HOB49_15780, partial [Gemmatimonadetes bacterium]|nr:hypothetical protein [Gemmatimonadota bacterium]